MDPSSGQQITLWIHDLWPAARVDLSEGSDSYLLHVWIAGTCLVIERRGCQWGFTPDLRADEPGFDSGHPFVFDEGGRLLASLMARMEEVVDT